MAKPEDALFKSVKNTLYYWKIAKIVIHYDDTRRLGLKNIRGRFYSHKTKGTPDVVAYFKHQGICGILFIELKTENDTIKQSQIEFMMKFKDLTNVHYIILKHPHQIHDLLEKVTGHTPENILPEVI